MNDANMIQLVVGTLCAGVTGVSAAFVVYWHVFAKKHLTKATADTYTGRPAFQLPRTHYEHM